MKIIIYKEINLGLCYLYHKKSNSFHKEKLLSAFEDSISLDIAMTDKMEEHNFYIFELNKVDKILSTTIKKMFVSIPNPLIYFLIPKEYNLSLFQLAFMINAKSIITSNQDIDKVIAKIKNDYQIHIDDYKGVSLGKHIINHLSYMVYEDSKLDFVSEQLYREFDCSGMSQIQEQICSKLDMKELLSDEHPIKKIVANNIKDDTTYFIKSIKNNSKNIISFEAQVDYEPRCNEHHYVSTRVSFVELLKDKLLEKMISDKLFSILTIKVDSVSKLLTKADEENFRKEFLYEVELILDIKLMLAEYDTNMYIVLFEDLSMDELKEKAKNFHLQIANFLNRQELKYLISLYAINIDEVELNPILSIIDDISNDEIDYMLSDDKNVSYINNYQDSMDEKEMIHYLLESIFINKSKLNLLNIHNGMCINTSSKILKMKDDLIFVKIEHLQGIVMNLEKKTIFQSPIFTKSIRASLKYINIEEGYAVLHKCKILDYNPNERQHGRVNSVKLVPVALSLLGTTIKGEMVDVSATSMAIKIRKTKILDNILNKDISLTFYLENNKVKSGSTKLEERAIVIHQSCDNNGYSKLICIFCDNIENEKVLIEYIFNRQKSIILDMKNMVR